jgi:hypothetical protein
VSPFLVGHMSVLMFFHMDFLSSMGGGGSDDSSERMAPVVRKMKGRNFKIFITSR